MDDLDQKIEGYLDEEKIIKLIPNYNDNKLADIVISFRHLGLFKNLFIAAMEELAKRRNEGNEFDYEKYIEDNLALLPKLDFKIPDLSSLIGSLKNFKK